MCARILSDTNLWSSVKKQNEFALQSGAIKRTDAEIRLYKESGLPFIFKIISGLLLKPHEENLDQAVYLRLDPFLSADSDILVGYVGSHHQILLSKFSVVEEHLVIATREFKVQGEPLTHEDLDILWQLLSEERGLAIYNGGPHAGGSQLHKHTQFIPTRHLYPNLIDQLLVKVSGTGVCQIPALPFMHQVAVLSGSESVSEIEELYWLMLNKLGLFQEKGRDDSHSTLLTKNWLLIAPRSASTFQGIHVNAFAVAGYFFPKSEQAMETLMSTGCMNVLTAVTKANG